LWFFSSFFSFWCFWLEICASLVILYLFEFRTVLEEQNLSHSYRSYTCSVQTVHKHMFVRITFDRFVHVKAIFFHAWPLECLRNGMWSWSYSVSFFCIFFFWEHEVQAIICT
jgi:hypothetical protein